MKAKIMTNKTAAADPMALERRQYLERLQRRLVALAEAMDVMGLKGTDTIRIAAREFEHLVNWRDAPVEVLLRGPRD